MKCPDVTHKRTNREPRPFWWLSGQRGGSGAFSLSVRVVLSEALPWRALKQMSLLARSLK